MASVPSSQDMLISSFLDIAVDQTVDTAREFLQATNWSLEEAIQRFFSGNNNGGAEAAAESFNYSPLIEENPTLWESDDVRLPLPVRREVLYGENSGLYEDEREQISSSTFDSYDNNTLSVLFRPPYELLYNGPFDHAKEAGAKRNRWLLVNVQSRSEFASDTLNRDTWANDIVAQMIENNFVFWQEGDHTEEGRKVCTYYKLDSRPVILVIDPITGQNMRSWNGMVQPETLLEDAMTFIDRTPSEYHSDLLRKQFDRLTHLDRIEEEPNRSLIDKNLVCRIAIRLPDGRRIQRNFMKTDPIKLLWSFCSTQFEEAKTKAFRFRQAMPGPTKFWASNFWTCDSNLTFEESGLDNSVIALVMI
ncbi:plant UBX domain-containing protein 7-like [Solanum verrucosum]|uniref:plant UBX domain-containing protein 7-like n=1 Tax=Solanum verrucosum TaxID=315347 RepID=UPI0020D186D3|nr:plant UBX domain-containing protein 7-like [Solanum verrucosum]